MGQLAGVAAGSNGTLWVLHRGDRAWDQGTFHGESIVDTTPIQGPMVLHLEQDTGKVCLLTMQQSVRCWHALRSMWGALHEGTCVVGREFRRQGFLPPCPREHRSCRGVAGAWAGLCLPARPWEARTLATPLCSTVPEDALHFLHTHDVVSTRPKLPVAWPVGRCCGLSGPTRS